MLRDYRSKPTIMQLVNHMYSYARNVYNENKFPLKNQSGVFPPEKRFVLSLRELRAARELTYMNISRRDR